MTTAIDWKANILASPHTYFVWPGKPTVIVGSNTKGLSHAKQVPGTATCTYQSMIFITSIACLYSGTLSLQTVSPSGWTMLIVQPLTQQSGSAAITGLKYIVVSIVRTSSSLAPT